MSAESSLQYGIKEARTRDKCGELYLSNVQIISKASTEYSIRKYIRVIRSVQMYLNPFLST